MESNLVFCSEVEGLINDLEITQDWILRLCFCTMEMVFHLVEHAVHLKERYVNLKKAGTNEYKRYSWYLCGDFKVVAFLMGLQQGYTQNTCVSYVGGTCGRMGLAEKM